MSNCHGYFSCFTICVNNFNQCNYRKTLPPELNIILAGINLIRIMDENNCGKKVISGIGMRGLTIAVSNRYRQPRNI